MVKQQDIEQALQSAVAGGQFMAANLTSGDGRLIFAAGLANFINAVLADNPRAKLSEVRDALLVYARSRQH
jgi:hypothetical protein